MGASLLCVINAHGVPLLSRVEGMPSPSFPSMGLLSAVFLSSAKNGFTLRSLRCQDARVVFREFDDGLLLVLVTSILSEELVELERRLEQFHDAMVLLIGETELHECKHVEQLKRHLRTTSTFLDTMLQFLSQGDMGTVAGATEVVLSPEEATLRKVLETFAVHNATPHAALFCHGRVLVATHDWWDIDAYDLVLLTTFIRSLPAVGLRDLPVYLPRSNPSTPYRLIVLRITHGMDVVLLAGPEPNLQAVEDMAHNVFGLALPYLKQTRDALPWTLPPSVVVDPGIIGMIVHDYNAHRILMTFSHASEEDLQRRKRFLTTLFRLAAPHLTYGIGTPTCGSLTHARGHPITPFLPSEEYLAGLSLSAWVMNRPPLHVYLLFAPSVPSYAFSGLAEETVHLVARVLCVEEGLIVNG